MLQIVQIEAMMELDDDGITTVDVMVTGTVVETVLDNCCGVSLTLVSSSYKFNRYKLDRNHLEYDEKTNALRHIWVEKEMKLSGGRNNLGKIMID